MIDFFGIFGIGTTTFVATNIDDLLILIAFFCEQPLSFASNCPWAIHRNGRTASSRYCRLANCCDCAKQSDRSNRDFSNCDRNQRAFGITKEW